MLECRNKAKYKIKNSEPCLPFHHKVQYTTAAHVIDVGTYIRMHTYIHVIFKKREIVFHLQ